MTGEPAPGLRRNRNWQLLLGGQTISITGTSIFNTTVVLWIATLIARDKPLGPQAVGGVLIAAAVPALVIRPLAGVFVDRWDRRTMMTCDACCAVLIAALLPRWSIRPPSLPRSCPWPDRGSLPGRCWLICTLGWPG